MNFADDNTDPLARLSDAERINVLRMVVADAQDQLTQAIDRLQYDELAAGRRAVNRAHHVLSRVVAKEPETALATLLREVLVVLDAGASFQCGPKGKHHDLPRRIRDVLDAPPVKG